MLGNKGLTSSEASRVANFIKEIVKPFNVTHDNFKVISSTAIRAGKELPLDSNVKIDDWTNDLNQKAKYFSLSTWLREAIQLKDEKLTENKNRQLVSTVELEPLPDAPVQPSTTMKDYLATLNTAQLAEYWTQHSVSAHIGKFIHNFDTVREQINDFQPTTFKSIGASETLTVQNTLLYEPKELYEQVESLQGAHRESNKVLNYHEAKHKEWENNIKTDYQRRYREYLQEVRDINLRNNAATNKEKSEFETNRIAERNEISALKIIIPDALQPILDEVYERFKVD